MTALLDVQSAVYQRLHGDASLLSLATGGVYDAVPQGNPMPYVVIGEKSEVPDNTLTEIGKETTTTIHIWSNAEGDRQALQILERIDTLLDNQSLTVNGWDAWRVENEFSETLRETDQNRTIRHVVARYRITLTEE